MQLPAYGPDAFLRFAVRNKLKQIRRDDILMTKQGVDTLTDEELGAAVRMRGMTSEMSRDKQRLALKVRRSISRAAGWGTRMFLTHRVCLAVADGGGGRTGWT